MKWIAWSIVSLVAVASSAPAEPARIGDAAERAAYLGALRARLAGGYECFPAGLSEEEMERIIAAENGALPPAMLGLDPDERFVHSTTVWTGTGLQGGSGLATPARLSYSFPDDGVLWGQSGRPIVPNDLNSALAHVFGGANHDLGREYLRQALAGWRRTAAISYYQVADDNSQEDTSITHVATRGDARIGAGFAWPDTYLAYNFFPSSGGDMFFNSRYWEGNAFSRPNDSFRYLRNTAGHEHGHGLGFFHSVPCNNIVLMEPFLNTVFDQQQIDDIRNSHRNYGDRFAGNNSAANAVNFGSLTAPSLKSIIERTLSTNGSAGANNTDEDWFRFTLGSSQNVVISVVPTGGSYVNGPQSSGCAGTTTTVNASAAGNLNVELRDSTGTTVILSAAANPAGVAEVITANARPAGTYTVRVVDVGPNSSNDQVLQTYDLEIRVGAAMAPPSAIAGVDKRLMAGVTCFFLGDINSRASESGATLTTYDWDLDGNGSFETLNNPRPTTVYLAAGSRIVTLRVTDSNGMSDTDVIEVQTFGAAFALHAVTPYPFRDTQGLTVPITLFGANLAEISSVSQVTCSGVGTSIVGTPSVNGGGTQITGLSVAVASNAPKGTRVITATGVTGAGTASFFLYPPSPGAFAVTSPTEAGTTPTAAPLITWSPSSNAAHYLVQVAIDPGFVNIPLSSPSTLTTTAWQAPFSALTPGNTYFVRVRSTNETSVTSFTPGVSFVAGAASGNNNACADAITVFDGPTPIATVNATTDGPIEPSCESGGYNAIGSDVWFEYLPTANSRVGVSLCGATYDSMVAVYAGGCPVVSGTVTTCNDDSCGGASQVGFNGLSTTAYLIRVGGWQAAQGYATLDISSFSSCMGDSNNDSTVTFADVSIVLANWGAGYGPPLGTGPGDANHDGSVDFADVTAVLSNFGVPCP